MFAPVVSGSPVRFDIHAGREGGKGHVAAETAIGKERQVVEGFVADYLAKIAFVGLQQRDVSLYLDHFLCRADLKLQIHVRSRVHVHMHAGVSTLRKPSFVTVTL